MITTTLEFKRTNEIAGTCLQGYIEATREQLETVFGTPGDGDGGYKFYFDWGIEANESDGTQTIATIYDWKYERKPELTEMITWNIGGNSREAVRVIETILCNQLGLKVWQTKGRVA
jgi:hypothetical protein